MAHLGFSNQLFGFNKSEVNFYLEKLQKEYKEKENGLNKKISNLLDELEKKASALAQLELELAETKSKLQYYSEKEAEIEKTSMSIATMYLVAKQNSEEMLNSAKETAAKISELSRRQLSAADDAGEKLTEIRAAFKKSAADFEDEVSSLALTLDDVKNKLSADMSLLSEGKVIEITDGGSEE